MDFLFIAPWLDFSPIKPTFGLLFWSTIIFLIFWLIIGKFAFKPIVKALNDRADDIQKSLDEKVENFKTRFQQIKEESL